MEGLARQAGGKGDGDGRGNVKNFCSLMEGGAGQGESHRLDGPDGPA